MVAPAVPLTEYQQDWINDRSRLKYGLWSRQVGKTFGSTLEIALDMAENGSPWVCLSRGERQSRQLMRELAKHLKAIGQAADVIETDVEFGESAKYKQLEIRLPNGAWAIGLPANPDTARGWSANIYLDEFAIQKESREIWQALYPSILRGYRVIITTTPKGKKNMAYSLWTTTRGKWSRHRVTIHDAIRMGLELKDEEGNPCTAEDIKAGLNDDEAWTQEFMCEFVDEATAWLSYELIGTVEHEDAIRLAPWSIKLVDAAREAYQVYKRTKIDVGSLSHLVNLATPHELYGGVDIGRTRDLTVIWVDELIENVSWSRAVIDLAKTPFWIQEKVVHAILGHSRTRRFCIDSTGIGAQLAETAQLEFGEHKVEAVTFNNANKEAMAGLVKTRFEDGQSRVPIDDTIRESLHAIKRMETATGHFRFDAERSEKIGHADHFWAKALCEQAHSDVGPPAATGYAASETGTYHAQPRRRLGEYGNDTQRSSALTLRRAR